MTDYKPGNTPAPRLDLLRYQRSHRGVLGAHADQLLDAKKWKTRVELSTAIFDWIEAIYNQSRHHSSLGNISPAEF